MEQYIPKSALVAEIKRRIELNNTCQKISGGNEFYRGAIDEAKEILSFTDALEVKEVELEKEAEIFVQTKEFIESTESPVILTARHFFELGMRASNPLTWEDINLIDHLLFDIKEDYDNGKLDKKEYYKEVLKKFKEQL